MSAYKESEKRWCGPVTVVRANDKNITVSDEISTKTFNISQIIPAEARHNDIDLKLLLAGINKYMHGYVPGVFLTEVTAAADPKTESPCFKKAIVQETGNFERRGCFLEMDKREFPSSANILPSHFVFTIKNVDTSHEAANSRLVAQGHTDKEKPFIIYDSVSLTHSSLRIILTFATTNDFYVVSKRGSGIYPK